MLLSLLLTSATHPWRAEASPPPSGRVPNVTSPSSGRRREYDATAGGRCTPGSTTTHPVSLRAVTVFGTSGDTPPTLGGSWAFTGSSLHDDPDIADEFAEHGIEIRRPGELPFTDDIPG